MTARTMIVLFVPSLAALTRAERKFADLKWPVGGVVTVCGPGGRLTCAVIATSGFVTARPAELIAGETVVRADVEEIQGNSEEG